jgi:DNA-binding LacI/PurR family transcriptional regulator
MSVTQQQIADKLNISRSLVARALRGHAEVAQSTRERIEAAARELGYSESTNQAARRLITMRYGRQLRTNTLAVIFPASSPTSSSPRRIPFYIPIFEGMEQVGEELDLDICVCLMRSGKLPRLIQTRSVDGVVVLGEVSQHIDFIREMGLPVVAFECEKVNAHTIAQDNRTGGYQATRHLLELGHRRIAFLGIRHEPTSVLRLQGYRDAMREAGITVHDEWIDTSWRQPFMLSDFYCSGCGECAACMGWKTLRGRNGGSAKRPPNFSAVVCHNDPVAMGVIDHAWRDGLEVPRDLSVTGFDDVSHQYHFHPEVTSIYFSKEEMGAYAVRVLHQTIENGGSNELLHQVFPTELVVRQSTAAPASYD